MKENMVLFASPLNGRLVRTHLRIYTELQKRGVKVVSIDCRTAKVLEPGKIQGKVVTALRLVYRAAVGRVYSSLNERK